MQIRFTINGIPKSKITHRTSMRGGFPVTYSPKENRQREQNIILQANKYKPKIKLTGAIHLDAVYYMPIPKSWAKWRREFADEWMIPHTKKPDVDNLTKMLCDALKRGGFYQDDNQVFITYTRKYYSSEPRTEVIISEYQEILNKVDSEDETKLVQFK